MAAGFFVNNPRQSFFQDRKHSCGDENDAAEVKHNILERNQTPEGVAERPGLRVRISPLLLGNFGYRTFAH